MELRIKQILELPYYKMVKVKPNQIEYYMDGYLQKNLDASKKLNRKDWDSVFIVDGSEGSGKSTIALQAATYCDPKFTEDRVCFKPDKFKEAIINATEYQSVVYDEAFTGLSSRSTMGRVNRMLVSMLAEIRQKKLFVFIVAPTFFDMDKYVALWRSRALIHVYTNNMQRGFFRFYNYNRKKGLYLNGKKFYSYNKPGPNFIGKFYSVLPIDEQSYRKKKYEALKASEEETHEGAVERRNRFRYARLASVLKDKYGCSVVEIAELTNVGESNKENHVSDRQVYYFLKALKN